MAREIFTPTKKDIDTFIKHQVDLAWGEELTTISHVPKILYVVLEQILNLSSNTGNEHINNIYNNALTPININNLKTKSPGPCNLQIFKCFNGSSEWKEEYEKQIVDLKISLNRGHWNLLKEVEDLNILIELLFDWFEDCVICVILPEKIQKLYKDDRHLSEKIKQHINDPKNSSSEERKKINDLLKSELRMIEYETLTCLAQFASHISPIEDKNEKDEFHSMLEKIAIYLLGYNLDMVYENSEKNHSHQYSHIVGKLIDVIYFMVILIEFEYSNDNNLFLYNRRLTANSQIDNLLLLRQIEEMAADKNNTNFRVNDLTTYFNHQISVRMEKKNSYFAGYNNTLVNKKLCLLSGNSLLMSNFLKEETPRSIEKEMDIRFEKARGKTDETQALNTMLTSQRFNDNEKEAVLFSMYKSLQKYFDKKNNTKNLLPSENMYFSHNVNSSNNKFNCDDPLTVNNKFKKNSNEIQSNNMAQRKSSSPEKDQNGGGENLEMLNDFYESLNKFIGHNGAAVNNYNNSLMNLNSPDAVKDCPINGNFISMKSGYNQYVQNSGNIMHKSTTGNNTIQEEKSKEVENHVHAFSEHDDPEIILKNKKKNNKEILIDLQSLPEPVTIKSKHEGGYNTVSHKHHLAFIDDEDVNQANIINKNIGNSFVHDENIKRSSFSNGNANQNNFQEINIEPKKKFSNYKTSIENDKLEYNTLQEANLYPYIRPKSRKRTQKHSNSGSEILQNNDNNSLMSLQIKRDSSLKQKIEN